MIKTQIQTIHNPQVQNRAWQLYFAAKQSGKDVTKLKLMVDPWGNPYLTEKK